MEGSARRGRVEARPLGWQGAALRSPQERARGDELIDPAPRRIDEKSGCGVSALTNESRIVGMKRLAIHATWWQNRPTNIATRSRRKWGGQPPWIR